jgi:ribonuclease HI
MVVLLERSSEILVVIFFAASCDYMDYAIDATTMEALALLAGLQLADRFSAQCLVVESDSMEVVHVVLDPSEFSGASAVVIDKCWHLLTMFLAWQR